MLNHMHIHLYFFGTNVIIPFFLVYIAVAKATYYGTKKATNRLTIKFNKTEIKLEQGRRGACHA